MIVILASWEIFQSFAFLVEVTFGIETVRVGTEDLRITVHLPRVRDDGDALRDVVAFAVIVTGASMDSMER